MPMPAALRFFAGMRFKVMRSRVMKSRGMKSGIFLLFCSVLPAATSAAKTQPAAALDSSYVSALAVADHLLQAWQSGDLENGMVLLSAHAKESARTEGVEKFFSNADTSGYEIGRGKLLKRGRYEFPVVLATRAPGSVRVRRRFSSIVVVNTGQEGWAVDKLP